MSPAMDSPSLSVQSTAINEGARGGTPRSSMEKSVEKKNVASAEEASSNGPDHEDEDAVPTYPEGGWRAWLVVLGVLISQTVSFGYTNAYGVYNDYYIRYYLTDYTSGQISWIGSVQLGIVLSCGVVSGRAFDRGYFYHLMIGGSILFTFCLFMLSLTQPGKFYQIFLVQGIGMGTATGMLYVPALGIISQYFLKNRPLALGLGTSGSGLGGVIHPIMLNKFFHGPLGFKNGVRVSAGINGGLLLISLILMKPRPLPRRAVDDVSFFHNVKKFSRDLPYVTSVLGTVFVLMGLYFPIYFIQLNAVKNGIDPTLAFYTIAILNGGSVIGRIIPNALIPKFGPYNVLIFSISVSAILVWCTLAVTNAAGTIIYCILFGFFSGAYISALAPAIGSLAQSDGEIGSRLGLTFTFTGIGGLIGTPIAGVLLTSDFHWWRPVVFAGLCVTVGTCLFVCTWLAKSNRKGTKRV